MRRSTLAAAHGFANVVGGLWPLLHMRSFEAVMGPKTDVWLVRTVAGLLVANGAVQLSAAGRSPDALVLAGRLGIGTSVTLGTVDLVYAPNGRISRMYLLDALLEAAWVAAWLSARRGDPHAGRTGVPHSLC
jgi:hypothetical protein